MKRLNSNHDYHLRWACDYSIYHKKIYSRFVNLLATVIDSSWDVYGTNHVQRRRRTDCSFTGLSGLSQHRMVLLAALLDLRHFRDHIPKTASRTDPVEELKSALTHGHKLERALSRAGIPPRSVIRHPASRIPFRFP